MTMTSLFRIRDRSKTGIDQRGFTLIELLVVISIIGLLSSIVLAALSSARQKGQYASVQESLNEMRTVYELQYLASSSYAAIMPSGMANSGTINISQGVCSTSDVNNYCTVYLTPVGATTGCDTLYGVASAQADAICKDILTKEGASGSFSFGIINGSTNNTDYGFAVQNQSGLSQFFCIRNSGNSATVTTSVTNCLDKTKW